MADKELIKVFGPAGAEVVERYVKREAADAVASLAGTVLAALEVERPKGVNSTQHKLNAIFYGFGKLLRKGDGPEGQENAKQEAGDGN